MNLLLAVLIVTFVGSIRGAGSTRMMRAAPLVAVCSVVAAAYLLQRVV